MMMKIRVPCEFRVRAFFQSLSGQLLTLDSRYLRRNNINTSHVSETTTKLFLAFTHAERGRLNINFKASRSDIGSSGQGSWTTWFMRSPTGDLLQQKSTY